MPVYQAPLDDIRFVLNELIQAEELANLPGYEETASPELVDQILEEGAKVCQDVLFPST